MDNFQVERIFTVLSDMDKRLIGRLDYLSDRISNLSSDVAALNAWRDSLNHTLSNQAEKSNVLEQRLRSVEELKATLSRIEMIEQHLEKISEKLEQAGSQDVQEELLQRVFELEKTAFKATIVWGIITFVGGIGLQLVLHFVLRVH